MSARALLILGIFTFVASMLRHWPSLDDVPDIGHEANITARFQGRFQRTWDSQGFLETKGRPIWNALPTTPVSGLTYINHPPLVHWLYRLAYVIDRESLAPLRGLAAIFSSLCCALVVMLCASSLGLIPGLAALAYVLSSPMLLFFGQMANFESPLLAWCSALFLLAGSKAKQRPVLFLILGLTGILIDWVFVFALPGVFLVATQDRLRRGFVTGIGVGCGLLAFLALLYYWDGKSFLDQLVTAYKSTQTSTFEIREDYLSRPLRSNFHCFGLLPIGLLFWSVPGMCLRLHRRRAGPLDRFALAFFVMGVCNVAVFPTRAYNHDFWWIYFVPTVACAVARVAADLEGKSPWLVLLLVLALPLQLPAALADRRLQTYTGTSLPIAELVNAHYDEETLIVFNAGASNWAFLTHAWVYDDPTDGEFVHRLFDDFQRGLFGRFKLVFLFPADHREMYQQGIDWARYHGAHCFDDGGFIFLEFRP